MSGLDRLMDKVSRVKTLGVFTLVLGIMYLITFLLCVYPDLGESRWGRVEELDHLIIANFVFIVLVSVCLGALGFCMFEIVSYLKQERVVSAGEEGDVSLNKQIEAILNTYSDVKKHPLFRDFVKVDVIHKHLSKPDQQVEFVKWLQKQQP